MKIVKGTRHLGIICKDIDKSLEFYRDFLGLKVIQDFWDGSKYINDLMSMKNANVHMIKLGADDGSVIELVDYATLPFDCAKQEVYDVGTCHIAFQVYDVEKAFNDLVQKSVHFLSEPLLSSEGFAKVCFCIDPDNTRIELVEML